MESDMGGYHGATLPTVRKQCPEETLACVPGRAIPNATIDSCAGCRDWWQWTGFGLGRGNRTGIPPICSFESAEPSGEVVLSQDRLLGCPGVSLCRLADLLHQHSDGQCHFCALNFRGSIWLHCRSDLRFAALFRLEAQPLRLPATIRRMGSLFRLP